MFLFRGYLISRFYPTREIHESSMYAKNMFYSINQKMIWAREHDDVIE